jgi:hypothetical protein
VAYKRIRVWDGQEWLQVGAQVPGIVDSSGSDSVTLSAGGSATKGISFGGTVFSFAPFVFVQVTGVNHATVAVTADAVGFTVDVKGAPNDTITFNWFAVQLAFS